MPCACCPDRVGSHGKEVHACSAGNRCCNGARQPPAGAAPPRRRPTVPCAPLPPTVAGDLMAVTHCVLRNVRLHHAMMMQAGCATKREAAAWRNGAWVPACPGWSPAHGAVWLQRRGAPRSGRPPLRSRRRPCPSRPCLRPGSRWQTVPGTFIPPTSCCKPAPALGGRPSCNTPPLAVPPRPAAAGRPPTAGAHAVRRHGICNQQAAQQAGAGAHHRSAAGADAAAAKPPGRRHVTACTGWRAGARSTAGGHQ